MPVAFQTPVYNIAKIYFRFALSLSFNMVVLSQSELIVTIGIRVILSLPSLSSYFWCASWSRCRFIRLCPKVRIRYYFYYFYIRENQIKVFSSFLQHLTIYMCWLTGSGGQLQFITQGLRFSHSSINEPCNTNPEPSSSYRIHFHRVISKFGRRLYNSSSNWTSSCHIACCLCYGCLGHRRKTRFRGWNLAACWIGSVQKAVQS